MSQPNTYRIEVLHEGQWCRTHRELTPLDAATYAEERDRSGLHDTRIVCERTGKVF